MRSSRSVAVVVIAATLALGAAFPASSDARANRIHFDLGKGAGDDVAAISLGITAGMLAVVGGTVWYYLHHRRRASTTAATTAPPDPTGAAGSLR